VLLFHSVWWPCRLHSLPGRGSVSLQSMLPSSLDAVGDSVGEWMEE